MKKNKKRKRKNQYSQTETQAQPDPNRPIWTLIRVLFICPKVMIKWAPWPNPTQPRPVPVRQVQSVTGDNRGGANCHSFLHGIFLDLYPPLLSGLSQFEQHPNERHLPTHGRSWAYADRRWICGGRKKRWRGSGERETEKKKSSVNTE